MGQVRITIESAGETDFAIGATERGRRVTVRQPSVGARLEVGARIAIDERFARKAILDDWAWEDPARRRVVELAERKKADARDALVAGHRAALARALPGAAVPKSADGWEPALRAFLERIPERPRELPSGAASAEEERVRAAVQRWVDWARHAPIDHRAFDRALTERFPHGDVYQRELERWTPLGDEAELLARLGAAPVRVPPDVMDAVRRLDDGDFRHAFSLLALALEGAWVEVAFGLGEDLVPRHRYFVVARLLDDERAWCVDAASAAGPLVDVFWADGALDVRPGPANLRALVDERLAFHAEMFGDRDDDALRPVAEWASRAITG